MKKIQDNLDGREVLKPTDIPQEVAIEVNQTGGMEYGDTVLISCRRPEQDESSHLLAELDEDQYHMLQLSSMGLGFLGLSNALNVSHDSARRRMEKIHRKLGAVNKADAATLIPMDEKYLRALPTHTENFLGNPYPNLTEMQLQLLNLLGQGKSDIEIANIRNKSPSGIRGNMSNLCHRLGLVHGPQVQGVELYRVSSALRNSDERGNHLYAISNKLQPEIVRALKDAEELDERGAIRLDDPDAVKTIDDTEILGNLEAAEFVPKGTAKHGRLSLAGFIALALMRAETTRGLMRSRHVQPLAREIIWQETNLAIAT